MNLNNTLINMETSLPTNEQLFCTTELILTIVTHTTILMAIVNFAVKVIMTSIK